MDEGRFKGTPAEFEAWYVEQVCSSVRPSPGAASFRLDETSTGWRISRGDRTSELDRTDVRAAFDEYATVDIDGVGTIAVDEMSDELAGASISAMLDLGLLG